MPATSLLDRLRRLALLLAGLGGAGVVAGQTTQLSPVFVTATRSGEAAEAVPFTHLTLEGDDLRESPNSTVDGALRSIPGFSLFRRTDSLVANPTTVDRGLVHAADLMHAHPNIDLRMLFGP